MHNNQGPLPVPRALLLHSSWLFFESNWLALSLAEGLIHICLFHSIISCSEIVLFDKYTLERNK